MLATAQDLNEHLTRTKTCRVKDIDGSEWEFQIRAVSLMTWDEVGTWLSEMKNGANDAFIAKVIKAVGSPTQSVLRRVLFAGIASPRISAESAEGSVCVADIIRRDFIALGLYEGITSFSCERIFKVRTEDGGPSPTP